MSTNTINRSRHIPQYVGSFYFNSGWQNAGRKALPELLSSLELDKCHSFGDVVDALRDNDWDESVPSSDHWNFHKDGCSCEVRGPGAQAEFHFWQ